MLGKREPSGPGTSPLYGDNGDPKVELLSSKSIFFLGVSFNLLNEDLQELESLSLRPMQIQL